jgi:hypothetical protein
MAEQNINGITIDLNRITRREFRQWTKKLDATEDNEERDELTASLAAKVITRWPFGDITADTYLDLGMADSQTVDAALTEALTSVAKKK